MDFAELAALASGHAEARAIQTALKLGIFEILRPSALDDAALAGAISANRRATALIANAMVALGLLVKRGNRYALTDASRRFGQRVALGALIEQFERDHRVGYQSRRAAIRGYCGGKSGVIERRELKHIENSQLERGLDSARFGVS